MLPEILLAYTLIRRIELVENIENVKSVKFQNVFY